MTAAHRRLLIVILHCACVTGTCSSASGREYELIPIRDGKDLTRGNKKVLVSASNGWERRGLYGYTVGFGLPGQHDPGVGPVISVETNHRGRSNREKVTPSNSYMGVNLETDIKELKHIESFDAGANGRLRVWRFRTYNRHYLLALIVQPDNEGRTEVDIYLSSEDPAQLMPYLNSLKEVARSIRIVDR